MALIELKKFKENMEEPCFVAWNLGKVTCNDKNYPIRYINLCGKTYPYVDIPDSVEVECEYDNRVRKKRVELNIDENEKIQVINERKEDLKGYTYTFDGIKYTINGIGYDSVKLEKNYNGKDEYYWYYTLRGKYILNKLFEVILQSNLII